MFRNARILFFLFFGSFFVHKNRVLYSHFPLYVPTEFSIFPCHYILCVNIILLADIPMEEIAVIQNLYNFCSIWMFISITMTQ